MNSNPIHRAINFLLFLTFIIAMNIFKSQLTFILLLVSNLLFSQLRLASIPEGDTATFYGVEWTSIKPYIKNDVQFKSITDTTRLTQGSFFGTKPYDSLLYASKFESQDSIVIEVPIKHGYNAICFHFNTWSEDYQKEKILKVRYHKKTSFVDLTYMGFNKVRYFELFKVKATKDTVLTFKFLNEDVFSKGVFINAVEVTQIENGFSFYEPMDFNSDSLQTAYYFREKTKPIEDNLTRLDKSLDSLIFRFYGFKYDSIKIDKDGNLVK